MEAEKGIGVITRASGIDPASLCIYVPFLSYEVLWTKMHKDASASRRPILGTSLPHGNHKSAAARRINHPVLVGRSYGYKTRIGRWQSSRLTLTSPQINSQSPSDGGLRARYASGEMLASLALAPPPSATGPGYVLASCPSPEISTNRTPVGRHLSLPDELARSARFVRRGPFCRSKELCSSLPSRR